MSDALFVGLIAVAAIIMLASVFRIANRAAYRNGVSDGFRAANLPCDPLYESNGVRHILRRSGDYEIYGRMTRRLRALEAERNGVADELAQVSMIASNQETQLNKLRARIAQLESAKVN